jgi:5-methylcytosine-specific restriction endonuclease McrA
MKDGFLRQCKECVGKSHKRDYILNTKKYKERRKKDYLINKESYIRKAVEWGRKNKDKRKIVKKRWADKNKVFISVINKNLNARKLGAVGSFTLKEYKKRLDLYNNHCGYCFIGETYTVDHIIPISKGGTNYIDNIMPACLRCNGQKRDYLLEEWFKMPNCYNRNNSLKSDHKL